MNIECSIICDYVYLDSDERRRFAQNAHEYLAVYSVNEKIKYKVRHHKYQYQEYLTPDFDKTFN